MLVAIRIFTSFDCAVHISGKITQNTSTKILTPTISAYRIAVSVLINLSSDDKSTKKQKTILMVFLNY